MPKNKWKPLLDKIAEQYSNGTCFMTRDIIKQMSNRHFVPNASELSAYISKDGRFVICGRTQKGYVWGVRNDKRK